jgi:hypothetical protein
MNDEQAPCGYKHDDKIQNLQNEHPLTSSSIDFLSHDQKLVLAVRSSMASGHLHHQPGAFNQRAEEITQRKPKLSHDEFLKNRNRYEGFYSVDDGLKSTPSPFLADDVLQMSSSEVQILDEFQEQMNHFQHEFELEIRNQYEEQLFQDTKQRIRIIQSLYICMGVIVILSTSLTISLIIKSHTNHNDIPNNIDGLSLIESCFTGNVLNQSQYSNVRSILTSYYPNLAMTIDVVGTNANVALCWLSQYDEWNDHPYPEYTDAFAQRFVMVLLYFHFTRHQNGTHDGAMFSKQNWLSNKDVCDWDLVYCEENISHFRSVTSLEFSDVQVKDVQFPSEIALLQNLKKLNFYPNILDGALPLELSSLTLLEEFGVVIWGARTIDFIDKIIEPWNNLEKLYLEISFPSRLPAVGAKTKLTYLELKDHMRAYNQDFPDIQELTKLDKRVILLSTFQNSIITYM